MAAGVCNFLHAFPANGQFQCVGSTQIGHAVHESRDVPRFEYGIRGGGCWCGVGDSGAGVLLLLKALNCEQLTFRIAGSSEDIIEYRDDYLEFGTRQTQILGINCAWIRCLSFYIGIVLVRAVAAALVERTFFARFDLRAKCTASSLNGQPFQVVFKYSFTDCFDALP